MTTTILLVTLFGLAPMQVRPFTSLAECEHHAAILSLTASTATRYRCVRA